MSMDKDEMRREFFGELDAVARAPMEQWLEDHRQPESEPPMSKEQAQARERERADHRMHLLSSLIEAAVRIIARVAAWRVSIREREVVAREKQAEALTCLAAAQERIATFPGGSRPK